jgi:hypothetical protein
MSTLTDVLRRGGKTVLKNITAVVLYMSAVLGGIQPVFGDAAKDVYIEQLSQI